MPSSPTRRNYALTLEATDNPAWYAVQSLPYLTEYPFECSEQVFSRLYANLLAAHVLSSNPRLKTVLAEWQTKLAPFKGAKIVSYHKSWPYFAERFGLQMEIFLEPKPGIPPSPSHLAGVIAQMKEQKARVIIVDPYLNRKTAETVARSTEATVLDVAQMPGGVKGTESYIALLDYLVNSLATALAEKK